MNKNEIQICGRIWTVEFSKEVHHEGRRGDTFKELQKIRINPTVHRELQAVTLVHEVLHAVADCVGIEDEKLTEEEFIKRMAPVLTHVLQMNDDIANLVCKLDSSER